ncbi:MAG: BTAD domain-containing putative transcriptional regulator [Ilumatobacteraceae bacterium]
MALVGREWVARCLGEATMHEWPDGGEVRCSPLQRRIVAALAVEPGRVWEPDALVDAVWGEQPPSTARASLHNLISRLRQSLPAHALVSVGTGYALGCRSDAQIFSDHVERAASCATSDPRQAIDLLDAARAMWRGTPFVDIADTPAAAGALARLTALYQRADTLRVELALATGDLTRAVAEAERLVADTPLDESRWAVLARALHKAGRRGDALGAVSRAKHHLRTTLGVVPGEPLREVERELLRDPVQVMQQPTLHVQGRGDVVARLMTHVDAGASVVIIGEDGSGRSTVLGEVRRVLRRRGMRVVLAGVEDNAPSAGALLDDILDELGVTVAVSDRDIVSRFVDTIADEARDAPVVLLVDDVHRAGPSALGALERCSRAPGVVVIATTHLADGVPAPLAVFRSEVLEPLTDDVVRRIVFEANVVGGRSVPHLDDYIVDMAGGNPLLVGQLLAEYDRIGDAPARTDQRLNVTDALTHIVERLIAPHGSAVRRAIDVAAVIGARGSLAVLGDLTSPAGVRGALASGLLIADGEEVYRFRHEAVARVSAARLPVAMRDDIHCAVAVTARRLGLPILAYAGHAMRAAALDPQAAWDDCMAAGDEVSQRGLHDDAREWYDRARRIAVDHLPHDAVRSLRARIRSGDSARLVGAPEHVADLLACAEESLRLGDHGIITEAMYALLQFGGTSQLGPEQQRAMRYARRAMAVLGDTENGGLIAAATTLTQSLFADPAESYRDFERALALVRDPAIRLRILPYAYMTFGHPRDLERREATAIELQQLAHDRGDVSALFSAHHQHWANAMMRGNVTAVEEHQRAMDVLVERIGTVGARWEQRYALAAVMMLRGELVAAEELSREAYELLAAVSPERAWAVWMSQVFSIRRQQGRLAELQPTFAALVERQPTVGAWRALHAATLVDHDPDAAHAEVDLGIDSVVEDFTWLAATTIAADVVARVAAVEWIDPLIERLAPYRHLTATPLTCAYGPVEAAVLSLEQAKVSRR